MLHDKHQSDALFRMESLMIHAVKILKSMMMPLGRTTNVSDEWGPIVWDTVCCLSSNLGLKKSLKE